jgi:hypothetical protein
VKEPSAFGERDVLDARAPRTQSARTGMRDGYAAGSGATYAGPPARVVGVQPVSCTPPEKVAPGAPRHVTPTSWLSEAFSSRGWP